MLTPQEVSEHAFTKAFNGYNMAMVDEFLDILSADYEALYKENATLKAKMKVLVEKVEEYRSTEDAMRKALMTAQKMADDLVAEAQTKRDQLMQAAEQETRAHLNQLRQNIRDEEARLAAAQKSTADYVMQLKDLYQHQMDYLSGLSRLTAPQPEPSQPAPQPAPPQEPAPAPFADEPAPFADESASREGDGSLYDELMELKRRGSQSEAPQPQPEEEDPMDEPTRRIDFSNLQFGRDYEIR